MIEKDIIIDLRGASRRDICDFAFFLESKGYRWMYGIDLAGFEGIDLNKENALRVTPDKRVIKGEIEFYNSTRQYSSLLQIPFNEYKFFINNKNDNF